MEIGAIYGRPIMIQTKTIEEITMKTVYAITYFVVFTYFKSAFGLR
ncbi:Uncharacterised protein [Serratia fonticola]|uniref:Uncharacterized protein n=1 Tax=Serratia fonticola TaxID=47917 RepID=A0A4V6KU24_SERFO|nr:Uncharacterised protein [Serratia fonticola]